MWEWVWMLTSCIMHVYSFVRAFANEKSSCLQTHENHWGSNRLNMKLINQHASTVAVALLEFCQKRTGGYNLLENLHEVFFNFCIISPLSGCIFFKYMETHGKVLKLKNKHTFCIIYLPKKKNVMLHASLSLVADSNPIECTSIWIHRITLCIVPRVFNFFILFCIFKFGVSPCLFSFINAKCFFF